LAIDPIPLDPDEAPVGDDPGMGEEGNDDAPPPVLVPPRSPGGGRAVFDTDALTRP
jgi:hypothetical protein